MGVLFTTITSPAYDLITNLTAWYKINDGSGTNIADSSGNSYTGTLTAGSGNWTGSVPTGPAGGAYRTGFNFSASAITLPAGVSITIPSNAYTISALVYGTSFASFPEIIGSAGGSHFLLLGQAVGNYAGVNIFDGVGGTKLETTSLIALKTATWTHVAATWDGSYLTIYQNGSLLSQVSGTPPTDTFNAFYIGSGTPGGNSDWAGYIQNVRFYVGRALNAATIAYLSSIKG